jgi:hypothetical protein
MDCINELRDSLNVHLGWNKARITCFVNMLLALLTVRTVNLNKLACVIIGETQLLSRYRRIQRFFAGFTLNYTQIAGFIFKLFFISDGQWYLSMDRTNWRWGNSDINILMLGKLWFNELRKSLIYSKRGLEKQWKKNNTVFIY